MNTLAIVLEEPRQLVLRELELDALGDDDVAVAIEWSGISTGTERLLWTGQMPAFPGMGYPLVPGYESVGRVVAAGAAATVPVGERVFVPGARCFGGVRGLFGGAASHVIVPAARICRLDEDMGEEATLLALAATACRAVAANGAAPPELIVGHGVLGRLVARTSLAVHGLAPTVWERDPARRGGTSGYPVVDPADDHRRTYRVICDVSGDAALLDTLISRLAPGGEIVLAGFYESRPSFDFPAAFMREARLRISAEWKPQDLELALRLVRAGRLDLSGLVTHRRAAREADAAYRTAFDDPSCLKMILDWRTLS